MIIIFCTECNKNKDSAHDFWYKDNNYLHICKDCLKQQINDWNVGTILPLCQILDIPFIEEEWQITRRRNLKNNQSNTFGKYLAKMKLASYKGFKFEDSAMLNEIRDKYFIEREVL